MIQTLSNWLTTSDNLLVSIQEKIKWADTMSQFDNKHRKDIEDKVEEVKKSISLKTVEEQKAREEEHKIREELVMKKNLELEDRLADMERKVKILLDIHDSQTPLDSFDDTLSGL